MRIKCLSDHARDQLGLAQELVAAAAANQTAWQQKRDRASDDLRAARRATPWWTRVLRRASDAERAARSRVVRAEQAIRQTTVELQRTHDYEQQQTAGVQGEDALTGALSILTDDWSLLRGYRNRRGETDHVLVGPHGVWAIEVKRRPVRVHIAGDRWTYEKLDRRGNVVETGDATDRSGRSWARQVTDVAGDLAARLGRNGHPVPVHSAVMLMHERAQVGHHEQLTVDLVANHPGHLLAALPAQTTQLSPHQRREIVRLIERDHRFHQQRRKRR